MCTDKDYIRSLGGPTAVADMFGYSVQRVSNWGTRGIPASVLLDDKRLAEALQAVGYTRSVRNEA